MKFLRVAILLFALGAILTPEVNSRDLCAVELECAEIGISKNESRETPVVEFSREESGRRENAQSADPTNPRPVKLPTQVDPPAVIKFNPYPGPK